MTNIQKNIPLADKTTYKIGGPASEYAEPRDEEEIIGLYKYASDNGIPTLTIGMGSNLLVSDQGFNGLVINLSVHFSNIHWNGLTAHAQSGCLLDNLASSSAARGFAGIEELSGIPGTIGGAVVMNAGAFGTNIAKTLRSVRIIRIADLTVNDIPASELALEYRTSIFKNNNDIILSATLEFEKSEPEQVISTRNQILSKRREKQPIQYPSCGSVFKRPPGNYAGTLIESCGLKGFKIGGTMVSEKHANFIINTGNAKAEDVRGVIRHVQKIVRENTGILLEPEVIFVGDFMGSPHET